MGLQRIISGGQTGVDRAALDAAMEAHIPCGGWCPKGRKAEDGTIPERYPLDETESTDYAARTRRNVRDSDGTLVLTRGGIEGGTAETVYNAQRMKKPCLQIDFDNELDVAPVLAWIQQHNISVLNVAGPRESKCHGIYADALSFLRRVLISGT
jgi:predicted Rossmann-fold nucleotide-binding protein